MGTLFIRLISLIPVKMRCRILPKILRRSAADSLSAVFATADDAEFEMRLKRFFDEIGLIIDRLAEAGDSGIERGRKALLLKSLLDIDNRLYRAISVNARDYDDGIHPKHRMIGYHDFFCKNIGPQESVLDIGCGNGFLTSDMAKCTRGRVVGIDINEQNIEFARSRYHSDNVEFILGDVATNIKDPNFDVVVMSNVLEHLSNRVEFLSRIREMVRPKKLLVRVPMFEREWMVPLKQEMGIDYMLDAGHKIEYTKRQLLEEFKAAGLAPEELEIRWSEFWCRMVPAENAGTGPGSGGR